MQERYLYEYSVIRVVPKVEREEFINVGLIVFSKHAKYIRVAYQIDEQKIRLLAPKDFDFDELYAHLKAFETISKGQSDAGVIGAFDIPERFRWLTAVRSTCLQTSRPHVGFSSNLDQTFESLFLELIG